MIRLVTRFHNIYYINEGLKDWTKAESVLVKVLPVGRKLNELVIKNAPQKRVNELIKQIKHINVEVTRSEDEFSFIMGEGARWLENVVLISLIILATSIGVCSIFIMLSLRTGMQRGIRGIINGASLIRNGDLTARVEVYSNDEIGVLTDGFNRMAEGLQQNINSLKETEEKLLFAKQKAETSEKANEKVDLIAFARIHIDYLESQGRTKSASTYRTLSNSLNDFLKGTTLHAEEVSPGFL